LANLAEVLEEIDGFFAAVAREVDAEELGNIGIGSIVRLTVFSTSIRFEPIEVGVVASDRWLVALLEWRVELSW